MSLLVDAIGKLLWAALNMVLTEPALCNMGYLRTQLIDDLRSRRFQTNYLNLSHDLLTRWGPGRDDPFFIAYMIMCGAIRYISPRAIMYHIWAARCRGSLTIHVLLEAVRNKVLTCIDTPPTLDSVSATCIKVEVLALPDPLTREQRLETLRWLIGRPDSEPHPLLRKVTAAGAFEWMLFRGESEALGDAAMARLRTMAEEMPRDRARDAALAQRLQRMQRRILNDLTAAPGFEEINQRTIRAMLGIPFYKEDGTVCHRRELDTFGFPALYHCARSERKPLPGSTIFFEERIQLGTVAISPQLRLLHTVLVTCLLLDDRAGFERHYQAAMKMIWNDDFFQEFLCSQVMMALEKGFKRLPYVVLTLGLLSKHESLVREALRSRDPLAVTKVWHFLRYRHMGYRLPVLPPRDTHAYPEWVYVLMRQQGENHDPLVQLAAAGYIAVNRGFLQAVMTHSTGNGLYNLFFRSPAASIRLSAGHLRAALRRLEAELERPVGEDEAPTKDLGAKIGVLRSVLIRHHTPPASSQTLAAAEPPCPQRGRAPTRHALERARSQSRSRSRSRERRIRGGAAGPLRPLVRRRSRSPAQDDMSEEDTLTAWLLTQMRTQSPPDLALEQEGGDGEESEAEGDVDEEYVIFGLSSDEDEGEDEDDPDFDPAKPLECPYSAQARRRWQAFLERRARQRRRARREDRGVRRSTRLARREREAREARRSSRQNPRP